MLRTLTALVALALAHGPPTADPVVHWRHSTSLGRPDHGSLVNGVQLPAEGITFFTWDPVLLRSPDRGWRRWGNDRLVRMVQQVVGEYWLENPDAPRVCIGDLSRRHGGDFQPTHASHQNGLDVDVYYPRLDGREVAPTSVDAARYAYEKLVKLPYPKVMSAIVMDGAAKVPPDIATVLQRQGEPSAEVSEAEPRDAIGPRFLPQIGDF